MTELVRSLFGVEVRQVSIFHISQSKRVSFVKVNKINELNIFLSIYIYIYIIPFHSIIQKEDP
jgi:hypothetical protein